MGKQFIEGGTLANRYQLEKLISSNHIIDKWTAFDEQLGESIYLFIFRQPLSAHTAHTLRSILTKQKGLLHTHIARIFEVDEVDGSAFYTAQSIDQAKPFRHEGSFQQQWQILRQLVEILAYAHSLGFCHGLLSPDNLLIHNSQLHLFNMGFAPFVGDTASDNASPELPLANAATPSDDIYSLGQLLHKALTGEYRSSSTQTQLPPSIGPLLTSMLQGEAQKRPTDLHHLKQVIDDYVTGNVTGNVAGNHSASNISDYALNSQAKIESPQPITHMLPRDRTTISSQWVIYGLLILATLGLGVFFFLPSIEPSPIAERSAPPASVVTVNSPEQQAEVPLAPLAAAKLKQLQADGQTAAQQLLRLQVKLEDKGGTVWAMEQYQQAVTLGLDGDGAYVAKQYQSALDLYNQGIQILQNAIDQVDAVFEKNLALGEAALKRGDARQAIEAFTILQTIRPSDTDIKQGLARAENLEEVQRLINRGSVQEREGELGSALRSYRSAQSLDSESQLAKQGISRINNRLANQRFNDQMSKGFGALNSENFEAAKSAFEAAQRLRPNSSPPKDGLDQLFVYENETLIQQHKTEAQKQLALEQWQSAINEYDAILNIASGTRFAHQGKAEATSRLALSDNLNRFITKSTLMMADSGLREAKKILIEASRISSKGPMLSKQINQLSHYVSQARVPVQVTLISNEKTLVTIYKVETFGKFANKSITLIPGAYTVVGKRKGYRDVTFELNLKGGEPHRLLTVSCTERI